MLCLLIDDVYLNFIKRKGINTQKEYATNKDTEYSSSWRWKIVRNHNIY